METLCLPLSRIRLSAKCRSLLLSTWTQLLPNVSWKSWCIGMVMSPLILGLPHSLSKVLNRTLTLFSASSGLVFAKSLYFRQKVKGVPQETQVKPRFHLSNTVQHGECVNYLRCCVSPFLWSWREWKSLWEWNTWQLISVKVDAETIWKNLQDKRRLLFAAGISRKRLAPKSGGLLNSWAGTKCSVYLCMRKHPTRGSTCKKMKQSKCDPKVLLQALESQHSGHRRSTLKVFLTAINTQVCLTLLSCIYLVPVAAFFLPYSETCSAPVKGWRPQINDHMITCSTYTS